MSAGKMAAAELIKFSDADFDKTIQKMDLKDLLDAISVLQREMTREQANFNALSNELGTLNKNTRQYRQISKEMTASQNKLTTLMNRSMKCFQQQGQQHILKQTEPSVTVQRHNSSREAKDNSQVAPVQRRHSGKLSNSDAEVIKTTVVKNAKPSQTSTSVQPVILKPLSNADKTNLAVKKQPTSGQIGQGAITVVHPTNQAKVNGTNGSSSDQVQPNTNAVTISTTKSSVTNNENSVRSSATFNLGGNKPSEQKTTSTKVVVNGAAERNDIKNSIINESRKPTASIHAKNTNSTGGNSLYEARNKMFDEIKRFDKKADLTKTAPKPTQPVEVNLGFGASAKDKQSVPVVKNEVKVQPSVKQTQVKASPATQAVKTQDQVKTQEQVVKTQDNALKTQSTTKMEIKTQNFNTEKSDTKSVVRDQFDKLLTDLPSGNSKESESESEDEACPPSPPEPEKFVSEVTFTHKPLNNLKSDDKAQSANSVADDKQKKKAPVPAAEVKVVRNTEPSKKVVDAKYEGTIGMEKTTPSDEEQEGEEEISPKHRNLKNWDPTKLLKELFTVKLMKDDAQDISDKFVFMEGLMEKLPMNKKKATLLKTWKRRFFRAKDGWLHYFETSSRDRPSDSLQLMGGRVDDLGNRILGVDDGRGRYLMVRCPTDREYGQWKLALESQTADNVKSTYVKPVLSSPPNPNRKVVVIDIGSNGIRAGILGQQASLPQLFFPSVVARSKSNEEIIVGIEAYTPEIRQKSSLMKAVRPTSHVDKDHMKSFNVDMEVMPVVFEKIWRDLKIDPSQYWVMMSTPQNLADQLKSNMFEILVGKFKVKGICMVMQALLSLYSYNATSGIIVDIGQRMEILPIYDGYVIEGGVSRQSYGGQKVADSLNSSLTKNKYVFVTPVEQLIVRYVMEKSCYVTDDYKERTKKCDENPQSLNSTVYLNDLDLPQDAHMAITHDQSCFESPEGFFNTDLWGMDYPCVHKLVFKAIQTCPIDSRKHMYRSIYLSGGVTMIPGFAERLQAELVKLAPPSVVVEVHNSPQRYHAAYIGACALGNMDAFEQTCISAEEWHRHGVKAFKKWSMGPS